MGESIEGGGGQARGPVEAGQLQPSNFRALDVAMKGSAPSGLAHDTLQDLSDLA